MKPTHFLNSDGPRGSAARFFAATFRPSLPGVALLLLALLLSAAGQALGAGLKAGSAFRVVTPDPLLPVSGGVGPSNPSREKKGEITVRALVLEQGETRLAFVAADFLGFPSALGDKVRKLVPGIPGDHIMIGATHTHSAPDCYGFPDETGAVKADLKYLDFVVSKMAEAINAALASAEPAELKINSGEAKGKIAYNYYAEQLFDPRCSVLQAVRPDGTAICTLVNYAIHPEVIGSNQGILSPDLCGPLYDRIEAKGGGMGLFINGAQGGMITADCRGPDGKDVQTWEECQRIGALLADEALRIVGPAPRQASPAIHVSAKRVAFPVESNLLKLVMKLSPIGYSSDEQGRVVTTLNLVNIGNAQILTIPGEALPNIGFYLKRKMKGQHPFLLGLTNDAFGYILTKEDFGGFKRYEYVSRTSLGEKTGPILVDEALAMVDAAPAPPKVK